MKIFVSKLDHIGDFALAVPWLRALADLGELRVAVAACNASWREVCSWVKSWHIVDFPGYQKQRSGGYSRWRTLTQLLRLTIKYLPQSPDVAVDLRTYTDDWRGRCVCRLTHAPFRVSLAGKGSWLSTVALPECRGHEFERIGRLVRTAVRKPDLQPAALPVFGPDSISKETQTIVCHPGAGCSSKLWPMNYWKILHDLVTVSYPLLRWTWLGGQGERDLLHQLACHGDLVVVSSSIRESLQNLAKAQIFVGLDSASAHLAALVGTTAITIFSAANEPERWAALGKNEILYTKTPCSPCGLASCPLPRHLCMEEIAPTQVAQRINEHLATNLKETLI